VLKVSTLSHVKVTFVLISQVAVSFNNEELPLHREKYQTENKGVQFPAGANNFSLRHHRVQTGSGAHPTSYPMGNGGSFPGVMRLGREADYSPPSNAEVKERVEL
jgi:hypothetical protein